MNTTETPEPIISNTPPLSRQTRLILALAATLPCLARKMNVKVIRVEPNAPGLLEFRRHVPWLVEDRSETWFDPTKFARCIRPWSTGERLCALFLLNVWNPSYAQQKRWRFNLFDFVGTCGNGAETQAVIAWMQKPIWP